MTSPSPVPGRSPETLILLSVALILVGLAFVLFLYLGPGGDASLAPIRVEILKSGASTVLQLIVLGIVGVAIKAAFDRHQIQAQQTREDDLRRRLELQQDADKRQQNLLALNEIRKTLLRRVLSANRLVRKARLLIPAHASAKTYGEQMRILIDVELEYSDIQHEITTIPQLFPKAADLDLALIEMQHYLAGLITEYREKYQEIVEIEKTSNRDTVRAALRKLRRCNDLVEAGKESALESLYLKAYWSARDAMRGDILNALENTSETKSHDQPTISAANEA